MLGPEPASQILKEFEGPELDAIASELTNLTVIDQELQIEVLREFGEIAVQASTALSGGAEFVQTALVKAVGESKASSIIHKVAPNYVSVPALQQILKSEPREVFHLVRHEQPQTIALLVSYFSPEKASEILAQFPSELRDEVVERIAALAPTPIEVVEKIVSVLGQKLQSAPARAMSRTGGVKSAAALLNAFDKNISKAVLESIDKRNPDLGQAIRQKMFTFDDVARLDTAALQKVLRQVDTHDLALALSKAGEAVKAALLSGISKRAAETVKEEMSFLGPVKWRDIEAAQTRVIEVVRQLESEGEIELNLDREARQDETLV